MSDLVALRDLLDGMDSTEKINAAVEYIKEIAGDETLSSVLVRAYLWKVLNKLDIFKCKGCKGTGGGWAPWDDQVPCPCPDCAPWGSKGWVIGEDDE
jgi:hypothetical protein